MTTPAIRALKDSRPGRRITLLTSPSGAKIAELVPEIDEVIVYRAPWLKATPPRADSRPEYRMADMLREKGFDASVIFTVFSQNPLPSAFLVYLAGVPLRLAHCHENPYQLLTHWILDPEPQNGIRHEVQRQLDLVAAIGCKTEYQRLSLRLPAGASESMVRIIENMGINLEKPWLVIHPGATAPSRRYSPEQFAQVGEQLATHHGFQILATGNGKEVGLVDSILSSMPLPGFNLAGMLSLAEFSALVEKAPVLITNNSGPAHIAAAVRTPVVDLYALTNPQHTPWLVPNRVLYHDVPCKYCFKSICPEGHHNCLRLVSPDAVVQATLDLLFETKTAKERLGVAQ
jgi:lipopolysaccharide heptosyltransferase II